MKPSSKDAVNLLSPVAIDAKGEELKGRSYLEQTGFKRCQGRYEARITNFLALLSPRKRRPRLFRNIPGRRQTAYTTLSPTVSWRLVFSFVWWCRQDDITRLKADIQTQLFPASVS